MANPAAAYDIPAEVTLRIGDGDPTTIATGPIPWPYDIPAFFRSLADEIERAQTE